MLNSVENDLNMARQIAIKTKEAGGCAYFVGGCVRDELMGIPLKDIDIEVHGITPKSLSDILDSLGEKLVIGVSFGVFGLRGYDLDIAMPRTEKATGRGHRDFEIFVDPFLGIEKACERRDFTINAMMKNVLTGEISDHFGGRRDLEDRVIRHVNDVSFVEDPLRVFRAAQFASRFGFSVAEETVRLCSTVELDALPSERVFAELEKALLRSERPSIFFEVLRQMDRLDVWFPELKRLVTDGKWQKTMNTLDRASGFAGGTAYPIGFMLSSLCTCTDGGTEEMLSRLTSERKLIRYVMNMEKLKDAPVGELAVKGMKTDLFRIFDSSPAPSDLILLCECTGADPSVRDGETRYLISAYLREYEELMSRSFFGGKELLEAGIEPGIKFKKILAYAHDLRLRGVDKETALRLTLEYAGSIQ